MDILTRIINGLYYTLLLRIKRVCFNVVPEITGRFQIINKGNINLGNAIRFYSTFSSNPIGMSKSCTIYVAPDAKLEIGNCCGFSGVSIYCTTSITIGQNMFCGANVNIWDTNFHPLSHLDRRNNLDHLAIRKPITIGDDVFVGANSIILKGVKIGDRAVVGAGSVVTKSIPADEIWAGNPAKFIKTNN